MTFVRVPHAGNVPLCRGDQSFVAMLEHWCMEPFEASTYESTRYESIFEYTLNETVYILNVTY